jgi:hypothetical protein
MAAAQYLLRTILAVTLAMSPPWRGRRCGHVPDSLPRTCSCANSSRCTRNAERSPRVSTMRRESFSPSCHGSWSGVSDWSS